MILNGPNLNLLGEREPHIYGSTTLAAIKSSCRQLAEAIGARGSRSISPITRARWWTGCRRPARRPMRLIINPAGLSFHSIPLLDALKTFDGPIVELHISNIHARDELHRHSIMSGAAKAVICGLGVHGYIVALQAVAHMLKALPDNLPAPLRIGPV